MGGSRQLICRNTRAPRTLPIRHVAPPIARVSRSSPRRKATAAKRFRVSFQSTPKLGIHVALSWDHVDCTADAQLFGPTLATHPRRARRQRRRAAFHMRLVVGITLLLLGLGMLSCRVQGSASANSPSRPPLVWIRTADGWEHSGSWNMATVSLPTLHPLVVAAGQGFASVLALVAFRRDDQ